MNEWEKDLQDLRLAEQAILKESLDVKDARLQELETEVRYLRRMLNDLMAAPRLQPAPAGVGAAPAPRPKAAPVPRRWSV